ncbi:DEAD/DEAH box helicase [Clavibacter sp. VKM Ac-2872]|uniref:DEAD/DEAH box helicase n=1 Tax=Clavibacter sp. VKM Ac-2872 TaxID=2783812 RepID=UPI00188C7D75|nr:DEAD/DEAH box helicase [Clavibacter sp. VKM Ac-2872]MBF4625808.1 ATP-binding protein [Clavibacter sp. VKM Ac-2872]
MLELFGPQKIPKADDSDRERPVSDWHPGIPLPWERLQPPRPRGATALTWRHYVFLGTYKLETTYEWLHRAFTEDRDAYDERPPGESACAALIVDEHGRYLSDSAILSSSLWAIGRIRAHQTSSSRWAHQFHEHLTRFAAAVDDAVADETAPAETQVLDGPLVQKLLSLAHTTAGVAGITDLATMRVRVHSVPISVDRADAAPEQDFLNSFYLDDLGLVLEHSHAGRSGRAFREYLAPKALPHRERVDVVASPEHTDAALGISRLPHGRWPSDPTKPLARSQQFAVNEALSSLAGSGGLRGVNGPPGTGKTTMLRDVLAANVVERARRLAALRTPESAFTSAWHRWTAGDYLQRVPQLRPELTGFEMVVASANNAAVENISVELPRRDAVHSRWQETADYFSDLAGVILNTARPADAVPTPAWGLVAAKLGNKGNRMDFREAFWFLGGADGASMQSWLKRRKNGDEPVPSWSTARTKFHAAERRVEELVGVRAAAQARRDALAPSRAEREARQADVASAEQRSETAETRMRRQAELRDRADRTLESMTAQRTAALESRPGWLETILSFGSALRRWRDGFAPIERSWVDAHSAAAAAASNMVTCEQVFADEERHLRTCRGQLEESQRAESALRKLCADDASRFATAYPTPDRNHPDHELRAPWLDEELDTARSELFLAALQLHQDWLANSASTALTGLRAAMYVVAGDRPRDLPAATIQAAWQLLFMVVPMVSTTFASAGRMFDGLDAEALGWLLIDEAGQACPQYTVGSIWRSRRVLVVGDPLQLEPVVTMPHKAERAIAAEYQVPPEWLPSTASVQTLADRVARFGTLLPRGDDDVWVSAPLRVHRRCDDPMFSFCNRVAYDGMMIRGAGRESDGADPFDGPASPRIAPSFWADEPAQTPGSHLQPREIERLLLAIAYLGEKGVSPKSIIAVSPFRAVARELKGVARRHPGMKGGTIHTAQGQEADVVFLVLGGDPSAPGAKVWASERVNLVNVAASRARRRLYVIGDRASWSKRPFFRELSESLR